MVIVSAPLFFTLFAADSSPVFQREQAAATAGELRIRACDDGSSPWTATGEPNWDCEIDACSPHESTCWDERLDFCFDDSGDDAGICRWERQQTCDSVWKCFKLWANCNGRYTCKVSGSWVGCTEGTCDPIPRMMTPEPPLAEADQCPVEADATSVLESSGAPLTGAQELHSEVRHLRPGATADTLRGRDA
jgi:hypothetical protein